MRTFPALALLGLSACATLDESKLSPSCRATYNACLNGCPQGNNRSPGSRQIGGPTGDALNNQYGSPQGNNTNFQIDVAECTKRCNELAKGCR